MGMNSNNNCDQPSNGIEQEKINFRNLCSWLLTFSPSDLVVLATIFSIIIAKYFNSNEQAVIGNFFQAIGQNIGLISTQVELQNASEEEKQKLIKSTDDTNEKQQNMIKRQNQYINQIINEINHLKQRLNKIEKNNTGHHEG